MFDSQFKNGDTKTLMNIIYAIGFIVGAIVILGLAFYFILHTNLSKIEWEDVKENKESGVTK